MKNAILIFLLLVFSRMATAQLSGNSPVNVGEQHTYIFSSTTVYPFGSFHCTSGCSVQSQSGSGTTYSAVINFTAPGSATITFKDNNSVTRGTKTVTINVPVPSTTFSVTQNCGSSTITRNSSPPSGINWYWQTTGTGTSTTNMSTTETVTSSTTRHLRARWGSTGAWSSSSQSTGTVSVVTTGPPVPTGAQGAFVISNSTVNATLSSNTASGATSYKWYTGASGGTALATTATPTYPITASSGTMTSYYIESFNGCPSASRLQVRVEIYPEPVITASNNGTVGFSSAVSLSVNNFTYDSYVWLDAANNPIAGATTNTYSTYQPGLYKVRVTKSSSSPFTSVASTVRTENFVKVTDALVATSSEATIETLPIGSKGVVTQFFDGLGRIKQTVNTQGSPLSKDVVQVAGYDNFGREPVKYLPYVATETNGWAKSGFLRKDQSGYASSPQPQFYQNTGKVAQDDVPYSEAILELSPLSRIQKQYGAGEAWSATAGQNKFVKFDYLANKHSVGNSLTQEKVIAWRVSSTGLPERTPTLSTYIDNGYYADNQLMIKVTADEEGKVVREYTNKSGQVVLKKVQASSSITSLNSTTEWACTYYVYDDLGNLRYVFQPELSKLVHGTDTYIPTTTELANLAFQYKYDLLNRMTEKRVPGSEWIYMVYDNLDRLILTQDGNQRATTTKYWTFTKYDVLGRPILTGIKDTTGSLTQATMQNTVNQFYQKSWTRLFEAYVGNASGSIHGYSNKSYPVRTSGATTDANHYLTVNYYDNYAFRSLWPSGYTYSSDTLSQTFNSVGYNQPTSEFLGTSGQMTGFKIKVLDGGIRGGFTWLKAVSYYDNKYRVMQTIGDNYKGGQDRVSTLYDFSGKVLKTKLTHVERDVQWKDIVGGAVVGNKFIKTANISNWGNSGAASVQQLGPGINGWIEATVNELNTHKVFGLADTNPDADYGAIDYALALNGNSLAVVENGGTKFTHTAPLVTGEIVRIERTGTSIKYYRNGTLFYTSTIASSTMLMADLSLWSYNSNAEATGSLLDVKASFAEKIQRVYRRFDYDHAGRLTKAFHRLNSNAEVLLSQNEYNELGQLIDQKLHSVGGSTAKQSVDYRYNIRGWLTTMNNASLSNDNSITNDETTDYFGFELGYNASIGIGNTALYNGNISGMKWSNNLGLGTLKEKGYNYTYDAMNRITAAMMREKQATWAVASQHRFSEKGYLYDLNGNITRLVRHDGRGNVTRMDSLIYNYGAGTTYSNRLLSVADHGDDYEGFMDGANSTDDYTYDANGNMLTDQNKGITSSITYNFLNLPEKVVKGANAIQYIYDATGRKLSQVTFYSGAQKQVHYCGEFQYENDHLQFAAHEEGRIVLSTTQQTYFNSGESTVDFVASNASLSAVSLNSNEKYVKASATTAAARAGISTIGGSRTVVAGERYRIRIKGYRDQGTSGSSNPVYLSIKINGTDHAWPGSALPISALTEAWVEQIVNVPSGGATMTVGATWNSAPTIGEALYINDVEVIKETIQAPEYQYNLKDHLGNVRLTFTTKQTVETPTAGFEAANQSTESGKFLNYPTGAKINTLASNARTGTNSMLLNGGYNGMMGVAKTYGVMPGDVVQIEAYAKYGTPSGSPSSLATFAGAFLAAFNMPAPVTGETGTASAALNTWGAGEAGGYGNGSTDNVNPKLFVTILVFDKNHNFLDFAFSQTTGTGTRMLSAYTVKQPGYAYLYVSNEHPTGVDAYFDDIALTHTPSAIIQQDEFYPFGLSFNSFLRESQIKNQYSYNGKEAQDELDLSWLDYGARMYMSEIARWGTIDNKAELYTNSTPYAYAANTPVNAIDPDGNLVVFINGLSMGDGGSRSYWQAKEYRKIGEKYVGQRYGELYYRDIYEAHVVDFAQTFNDHFGQDINKAKFVDGAPWNSGDVEYRIDKGYDQGREDVAELIASLDKTDGVITEPLILATHSLGAAYGRGYLRAIIEYVKKNPEKCIGLSLSVFDFDPQDASKLAQVAGVSITQILHTSGDVSFLGILLLKKAGLGNEIEKGVSEDDASLVDDSKNSTRHAISSFVSSFAVLEQGKYVWNGSKFVRKAERKKQKKQTKDD